MAYGTGLGGCGAGGGICGKIRWETPWANEVVFWPLSGVIVYWFLCRIDEGGEKPFFPGGDEFVFRGVWSK